MFDIKLHDRCDTFAQLFSLSVDNRYDFVNFVRRLMTDENLEEIIFSDTENEKELLSKLENKIDFKTGGVLSNFTMWFMGYTYMYWILKHDMKPSEVYKILPVEEFLKRFNEYYTENCDFVVEDAIKRYKESIK